MQEIKKNERAFIGSNPVNQGTKKWVGKKAPKSPNFHLVYITNYIFLPKRSNLSQKGPKS